MLVDQVGTIPVHYSAVWSFSVVRFFDLLGCSIKIGLSGFLIISAFQIQFNGQGRKCSFQINYFSFSGDLNTKLVGLLEIACQMVR